MLRQHSRRHESNRELHYQLGELWKTNSIPTLSQTEDTFLWKIQISERHAGRRIFESFQATNLVDWIERNVQRWANRNFFFLFFPSVQWLFILTRYPTERSMLLNNTYLKKNIFRSLWRVIIIRTKYRKILRYNLSYHLYRNCLRPRTFYRADDL